MPGRDEVGLAGAVGDPVPVAEQDTIVSVGAGTAMHAGTTGQALLDLAILGHDPGLATDRFTTAIAGYSVGQARSRAITQTKLASLTMATGDPLQAATIGHEALDAAGTVRSRRTLDDLQELNHHAAAHQDLEDIVHLRHRINTLLVRTGSP